MHGTLCWPRSCTSTPKKAWASKWPQSICFLQAFAVLPPSLFPRLQMSKWDLVSRHWKDIRRSARPPKSRDKVFTLLLLEKIFLLWMGLWHLPLPFPTTSPTLIIICIVSLTMLSQKFSSHLWLVCFLLWPLYLPLFSLNKKPLACVFLLSTLLFVFVFLISTLPSVFFHICSSFDWLFLSFIFIYHPL